MSDLRPSFEERDRYLRLLGKHYSEGRLDEAEFERRSDAVLSAVTHRDAMIQFEGLPKPNIVPVQGYRPAAGASYGPEPYQKLPVQAKPDPRVPRRAMLLAGGVGLGVVALISWANVRGPSSVPMGEEPVATMADPMLYDVVVVWDVTAVLQERGLDHMATFSIKGGVFTGSALAQRSPNLLTSFSYDQQVGDPVQILSVGEGEAPHTIPLDQFADAVMQTYDRALWELVGYEDHRDLYFELQWQDGSPRYRWADEGGGYALYDSEFELIELRR